MIFAILFVVAFLIGLLAYLATGKWLTASMISMGLFLLNVLSDTEAYAHAWVTILLGLPVVFFASLFGAYVVELRRGVDVDEAFQADESGNGDEAGQQTDANNTER